MDITPLIPKDKNVINAYGPEGFKINQTIYHNSIFLTPDQLVEIKLDSIEQINWQALKEIVNIDLEIILIGTGNNHQNIPNKIKEEIKIHYPQASIDEMSTSAACRTYNILTSEDRKVATILLPIK